jgi:sec-independent protein translocase protein TatA
MNIGWTEILIILLVILLLFGAKRLPELARALGQSLKEFKKGKDEICDKQEPKDSTATSEASNNNSAKKV